MVANSCLYVPSMILDHADLGDVEGQLGVLVGGLGLLGGDPLVDQRVFQGGRVELADELVPSVTRVPSGKM